MLSDVLVFDGGNVLLYGTRIQNDPIFSPIWHSTNSEVYPALKDLVMILRVSSQYIGSCLRPMMKETESDIDIDVRYMKPVALRCLEAIDAEEEQWEARCIDTYNDYILDTLERTIILYCFNRPPELGSKPKLFVGC